MVIRNERINNPQVHGLIVSMKTFKEPLKVDVWKFTSIFKVLQRHNFGKKLSFVNNVIL